MLETKRPTSCPPSTVRGNAEAPSSVIRYSYAESPTLSTGPFQVISELRSPWVHAALMLPSCWKATRYPFAVSGGSPFLIP